MLTVEQIARIAHEANRAYGTALGDHTVPSWDAAPVWQKDSAAAGVSAAMKNPDLTPEQIHAEWMAHKVAAGWKYGPEKRPEVLEHPCLVPWAELPDAQKVKDVLFLAVVHAVSGEVVRSLTIEMPYNHDGSVVKNAEIVPEVKPKKKRRFDG